MRRSKFFVCAIFCMWTVITGCNQSDDLSNLNDTLQAQNDANQYFEQANTLCMQGEFEKTIECCTKTLELNPEFANAYTLRGRAYTNLGDYQNAISDFDYSLKYNPDYILAHFFMANAYLELGDKKAALDAFRAFLQRTDSDLTYLQRQAQEKINELKQTQE